jgi:hypothetical protein
VPLDSWCGSEFCLARSASPAPLAPAPLARAPARPRRTGTGNWCHGSGLAPRRRRGFLHPGAPAGMSPPRRAFELSLRSHLLSPFRYYPNQFRYWRKLTFSNITHFSERETYKYISQNSSRWKDVMRQFIKVLGLVACLSTVGVAASFADDECEGRCGGGRGAHRHRKLVPRCLACSGPQGWPLTSGRAGGDEPAETGVRTLPALTPGFHFLSPLRYCLNQFRYCWKVTFQL